MKRPIDLFYASAGIVLDPPVERDGLWSATARQPMRHIHVTSYGSTLAEATLERERCCHAIYAWQLFQEANE